MAEHVIRAGRFLNPREIVVIEFADPFNGLRHIPDLVGIYGNGNVRADRFTGELEPAQVVFEVLTDLKLDLLKAHDLGLLLGQTDHLLVGIAEPSGGG